MSGNVLEWTRSLSRPYPYQPDDGREKLLTEAEYNQNRRKDEQGQEITYSVRGGAFLNATDLVRCAYRHRHYPVVRHRYFGFRVGLFFSRASH